MNSMRFPFLTFREMRLAREMQISEVAEILGVSEEVVVNYESDSSGMPISHAVGLCKLYRVPSIEYFYIGKENGQTI